MPSSLLGAHPAAASGGETPDETKPDKEGWDKPGDEALSFKDRTTLRSTMVASFEAAIKGKSTAHLLYDGSRKSFAAAGRRDNGFAGVGGAALHGPAPNRTRSRWRVPRRTPPR